MSKSASPTLIAHTTHPRWLSNTWLVADRPGGHAVVIDSGGPMQPITARIEELGLTLTHVLCTHHHLDHVAHNDDYKQRYSCAVCGGRAERELFSELDRPLDDGDEVISGDLRIRALSIPGHTLGQLAFVLDDERVFTGDTLFRGSVGGNRGPGHGTFEQLQHSIMSVLMTLPKDMHVHPGHMEETTIGREWEENPFVRAWREGRESARKPVVALGEPAQLLLAARDYDGGTKCWVRFADGEQAVVPGSGVRDAGA